MMNDKHSEMLMNDISHKAGQAIQEFAYAAYEMQRPCVVFKPVLSKDGDQYCALFGANLQEGVAGFGDTPAAAMRNFDAEWNKP